LVAQEMAWRCKLNLMNEPSDPKICWIVDDLVDSGKTLMQYKGHPVDALFRKPWSPPGLAHEAEEISAWLAFPWEHESEPMDAVARLIQFVGEDAGREGLLETPKRVTKALEEMTAGYTQDPKEILSKQFSATYDEMVVEANIDFFSLCEHHMLPFHGTCSIGYIPAGKVIGASKLARLVHCFARRLQIQERLTTQIAEAIEENLEGCQGIGVIIRAKHLCMMARGIKQANADLVTSCLKGNMRKPEVRAEFLSLCK
jgi:GTP cyclohydrolase I